MQQLVQRYWKPVYAYVRIHWAKNNEEAKDLTQDFFIWMMETGFVGRADPARGRFRAFVKVALERFLRMDQRKRRSLKRGGGKAQLSLPSDADGALPELEPLAGRSPQQVLDEEWRDAMIRSGLGILEERLRKEGKEVYFRVFRDYYLGEGEEIDYKRVGERHGISTTDVSNYLMHAKRRFRMIVSDLVAETVSTPEDHQEEMAQLFGKSLDDEP